MLLTQLLATVAVLMMDAGAAPSFSPRVSLTAVAYAPNGEWLAGAAEDRVVRLWDARNGSLLRTIATGATGTRRLLVTPDGQTLVVVSDEEVNTWSIRARPLRRFPVREFGGLSLDGSLIIERSPLQLWDLRSGALRWSATFVRDESTGEEGPELCPSLAAVSRDGRRALSVIPREIGMTGSHDLVYPVCSCAMSLWTVPSEKPDRTLRLQTCPRRQPVFSADGSLIVWAESDGALIWEAERPSAGPRRLSALEEVVGGTGSAHRKSVVLWGGGWLGVWNLETSRLVWRLRLPVSSPLSVSLSPDGEYVVAAGWSGASVAAWELLSGRQILDAQSSVAREGADAVAFEPHGRALAYIDQYGWLVVKPLKPAARDGR